MNVTTTGDAAFTSHIINWGSGANAITDDVAYSYRLPGIYLITGHLYTL